MKDRLTLAFLILVLWLFLIALQIYVPFVPSTLLVLAFIVFYCLVLAAGKRSGKPECIKVNADVFLPFVNIFLPAHNEEQVLEETVHNLAKIDYPHYEILIIDDRSKDNTAEIGSRLAQQYPDKVKYHRRPEDAFPGKSAVLNDALAMTQGEVICVFDADAKVDSTFLKGILPYLLEEKVGAVQARKIMSNKDLCTVTKCQDFEYCMDANVQTGRDSLRAATELRGNGELIKRKALEEVGGWNINTLTDDLDMSTQLHLAGFDIRFCPDPVVYEEAIERFEPIIKQRIRWAEGSIRRYLDYIDNILTSKKMSFKAKVDTLSYFSEFVLPVWLISDFVIQAVSLTQGGTPQIFGNIVVISAIGLFFVVMLFAAIRKFTNLGIFSACLWSIITACFVIIVWTIVVPVVVMKIIFKKRDMKWYKTVRVNDK